MWEISLLWYGPRMATKPHGPLPITSQVIVGDRGRLVLPAAIRSELGLTAGSRLLVSAESDGSLRLRPYRAVANAGRGLLAGLGPGSMVDELLEERRDAAAAEDASAARHNTRE
jgi:AbrB family looped-hinge helix DNA binding protein